ncbi:MAG: alpha/beta fold hydrolase [Patescibacteria group bacterium]
MNRNTFKVSFDEAFLVGDTFGTSHPQLLFIHGAGSSDRKRFEELRTLLAEKGISSSSFDFIGHGETGGSLAGSSLESRVAQASAVIDSQWVSRPLSIVASSMGGYVAIKLTELYSVKDLILVAPAVYDIKSYSVPFGPAFTKVIRSPLSWRDTDAWRILENYKGNILVYGAEKDQVIPYEVIERIYDSARNTRSKEVIMIKGAIHSLAKWLGERPDSLHQIFEKISGLFKPDAKL